MSITEIIQLSGHVEKLGIIGVLVLVCGITVFALIRFRKDLIRTYRQRDRCRMICVRYKSILDHNKIQVDIADIEQMFKDDLAEVHNGD